MNYPAINELITALSEKKRLHTLCNILAKHIGNPVAVALTSETLIGYSSNFTNDFISEFTSSTLYMSEEEMFEMRSKFQTFLKKGKAHTQAWPYLRHKQINCGCIYKESLVAVLIIPLADPSLREIDFELIESASRLIAVWLSDNGYITNTSAKEIQNLLLGLFKGDINKESQRIKLPYMDFTNTASYRMIWIAAPTEKDINIFEHKLAVLCKRAKQWWHISYENGFVVLIDAQYEISFPELEKLLEQYDMYACISDIFYDIMDTKLHFESVRFILSLRTKLNIEGHLFYEDMYKQIHASAYAHRALPSYVFHNEKLETIVAYDKAHSSSYLDTLRLYFQCDRNYERIAKALNIHKNTAFYRVGRLRELFGIDFDNIFQMLSLFVALNVYDEII